MAVRRAAKVLLLGWDAADWQLLSPLIDAGRLPCLARLVNAGTKADFASGFPLLPPLLWTSIATGHEAHRHGILGFTEPDPHTGRLRPVGSTSRKVKAVWNILSQQGFRTHVVGWFGSQPAEAIHGVCVSDQFANAPTTSGVPWPVPPGAVQPESLTETFTELRVRPEDLPLDQIRAFIPRVKEIDPRKDSRPGLLAVSLARCATQHAIATWLLEHEEWDFLAVQYNLLDQLGHLFMPFHPPRREGIPELDYDLYSGVMTTACQFLDMTLHRLLQLAGPEATVILCSEHGFQSGTDRPAGLQPESFETASVWHRSFGVFCAAGPGILKDELIHGARGLDVTPTVLTLLGVPVGADMPGRVLRDAFEDPTPAEQIDSWEQVEELAGMWPVEYEADPWDVREALAQLAELGYNDSTNSQDEQRLAESQRQRWFNLAQTHIAAGRYADALAPLQELHQELPTEPIIALHLAACLAWTGDYQAAQNLVDEVLRANPEQVGALLMNAQMRIAQQQPDEALAWLERASQVRGHNATTLAWKGRAELMLRRFAEAEAAFTASLERYPQNAFARSGRAMAHLGQARPRQAAEEALAAIGLAHFQPQAHLVLGIALARLGRLDRAETALRMSLSQNPTNPDATRWLEAVQSAQRDPSRRTRLKPLGPKQ